MPFRGTSMDRSRMAYLSPDFDYDVFVSYSHGDPRAIGESPLKTWSHALIEALIADITSLSDEFDELAVCYDRDLDPTLQLTPELRRKVKAAAVLMILMSPRYLKSAWCGDERTWFQEQIDDAPPMKAVSLLSAPCLPTRAHGPNFCATNEAMRSSAFAFTTRRANQVISLNHSAGQISSAVMSHFAGSWPRFAQC